MTTNATIIELAKQRLGGTRRVLSMVATSMDEDLHMPQTAKALRREAFDIERVEDLLSKLDAAEAVDAMRTEVRWDVEKGELKEKKEGK